MFSGVTLLWLRGSQLAASLVFALWLTLVLGGCGPQAALSTRPRQAATAATCRTKRSTRSRSSTGAGQGGERYYTADHYESFERIRLTDTDP